jgi:hypothetical protein
MKRKLLAFARLLKCFEEVTTDRGILVSDNDIVVGSEVFILKENGELTPADSGRYVTETMIYEVEGSFITKIEVVETQPEPQPEQLEEEIVEEIVEEVVEPDPEIEQLRAKITELEAVIKEKDEEIARLKAELEQPTEEIIENQKKVEEYSTQRKTGLDALRAAIRK